MTATPLLLLALNGCEFLPFITDDVLDHRLDLDGDGSSRPNDCDDGDAGVNPSADEICDGIDNNCDGNIDENDAVDAPSWYADVDRDGYGFGVAIVQCALIVGYANSDGDCDDQDAAVNPSVDEVCDGIDNDCDSVIDNDPTDGSIWYADLDGDTYGDANTAYNLCAQENGTVANATDCDDTNAAVNPAATELCEDEIDNNCNGQVDEGTSYTTQYADLDGDGYGDATTEVVDCIIRTGYVQDATDCDDTDAAVNPVATEVCNDGIDNNCDASPNDCTFEGEISASEAMGILTGEAVDDYAGWNVAGAGDIDDDGYDDVMVGAPYYGKLEHNADGIAYIIRGPITGESSLSDAYAIFTGNENSNTGWSVASAGDVNADGYPDLVVSASSDSLVGDRTGSAYIIHGPISGGTQSLSSSAYRILTGRTDVSYAGYSVAGAGDVNNDGFDDVLIGSIDDEHDGVKAGAAFIDFGPGTNETTGVETAGDLILEGEQQSDNAGTSVAFAGDVNADGVPDILIGAVGNDDAGDFAGAAYLLYGPLSGNVTTSLANADMKFTGAERENKLGSAVSKAGDMDNDGHDDLLIGANNEGGSGGGSAYLVVTATSGTESIETNGYKLVGESSVDETGYSVASALDLDQDGNNDLLIGAPAGDRGGADAGITYCVFGPVDSGTTQLSDSKTILLGGASSDVFGYSVASAGDVNADGFTDIIVGATRAFSNTGAVYLFSWLEL